jgi:hypothetical protein
MTAIRTFFPASRYAGAAAWILIAFGLLAVGLTAGTIPGPRSWTWTIPSAGFVGYVIAFRQGLLAWSRGEIDRIWRDQSEAPPEPDFFEDAAPARPTHAGEGVRPSLIRGRFAARSGHVRGTLPHS